MKPRDPAADLAAARAALAETVPRLTALIRGLRAPERRAIGVWSAGDVAHHLKHVWEVLPALARGEAAPPLRDIAELDTVTQDMVANEPRPPLADIAASIDAAAAALLARLDAADAGATAPWIVAGVDATPLTFACHLLNETMVHAYDIAHSQRMPWRIDPAQAALAIRCFVVPQIAMLDPRAAVVQERARGVHVAYRIHLRHSSRFVMQFDDGQLHIDPQPTPRIDCHISADPAAMFLLIWNRVPLWPMLISGRMVSWGRRPLLGLKLRRLVRNP